MSLLSRGAEHLFRLIHRLINKGRLRQCIAGQRWLADRVGRHIKASVRSIQRWTAELLRAGYIAITRRSQQTAMYRILKEPGLEMAGQMAGQMAGRIKEEPTVKPTVETSKLARKPMQVEIPPEYITVGERQYLNPAWTRVRDAIREAHQSGRVQNARNREAYIAAIIRGETRAS